MGGALSVNQDVLARITAATLRLGATAPGGTSASTVQLVGPITVAGTLDLRSLGAITQAGGAALAIGTLTGNAGGAILLANGGNGIGTVGDVAAGGNVGLTVAGAMTLAGLLSAPGQTVSLVAGSGIAEIGAGRVTAGTLAAQTGSGNIALGGGNVVDALGAVASAGAFTFNDAVTVLSVAAGITVSAAAGIGITQSGAFALGGQLVAPGQTVVLTAGTGIAGAGAITAATLIAQTASGDIALTGANAVAGLGDVTTPGAFTFNDTAKLLTIAGGATITTGTGAAISDTGGLAINGQIAAAGQSVALVAGAGIGGGGSIVAALLDVQTTGGGIVLTGANRFDALVAGAPGNITINDNAAGLVVPGAVVAGGVVDIINSGNMTVDGTVRGGTVTLRAGGILADNGVVAATAGPLRLAGGGVVVGGDVASTVGIVVSANTATLGGRATGPALDINAPVITFTGLAAAGTTVRLGLGGSGVATGALDAGGLVVAGGSAATLTGRIAGIGGGAAAVLGVRADAAGTPFGNPPPAPNDFTMNGCPLAVTVCHPLLVAPPTVATNPVVVMGGLNPRRFTGELTDSWFRLPTPINVNLLLPAARDPNEDLDLAPPNVRAEDY